MSEWTDSAKRLWADYEQQTLAALEGTGADPQEVLEDFKRHIEEEVATAKLGVVTEGDLRRILAKIGPSSAPKLAPTAAPPAPLQSSPWRKPPGFLLLILGVILPAITIVFEWFTGISADVLFDPIPTWFHIVIVTLVPIGNGWLWLATRRRSADHEKLLGWLNGFLLGVCIYYSILYVVFAPIACMGILYFGLGLIPLTPYLTLIATFVLRHKYCHVLEREKLPGNIRGMAIALICLLMLQLPESLTYYGLSHARSDDPAERDYGIKVLRLCGNRTLMLRACYGMLEYRDMFQPFNLLAMGGIAATSVRISRARRIIASPVTHSMPCRRPPFTPGRGAGPNWKMTMSGTMDWAVTRWRAGSRASRY